jgi:hypothetical protein
MPIITAFLQVNSVYNGDADESDVWLYNHGYDYETKALICETFYLHPQEVFWGNGNTLQHM